MIQHFFTSDDLPGATAGYVDEDASWWIGVQKAGATMALAAAAALSAAQTTAAQQVFSFHQDDPALTAAYEDEQTWTNPVQLIASWPPQLITDPEADTPLLTAGYLGDESWQNPVQVFPPYSPQLITDDQVIVQQAAPGIPDDNEFWQNPVAPIPYYVPPQLISDDQVIVPQPAPIFDDNEVWQPLLLFYVAPNIIPPPWLAEQVDIVPQPVAGVQNYVVTGTHNFVSQDMGSGVEF